jgi:hypothetical protein
LQFVGLLADELFELSDAELVTTDLRILFEKGVQAFEDCGLPEALPGPL